MAAQPPSAALPGKKADGFPREGNGRVGYTLGRISSCGCQYGANLAGLGHFSPGIGSSVRDGLLEPVCTSRFCCLWQGCPAGAQPKQTVAWGRLLWKASTAANAPEQNSCSSAVLPGGMEGQCWRTTLGYSALYPRMHCPVWPVSST